MKEGRTVGWRNKRRKEGGQKMKKEIKMSERIKNDERRKKKEGRIRKEGQKVGWIEEGRKKRMK